MTRGEQANVANAEQRKTPADVTVWAVQTGSINKSGALSNTDLPNTTTPPAHVSGALSDTIDNILGLLNKQNGRHPVSQGAARVQPSSGRPPSAKCINRALQAVLNAAEKTAEEKKQVSATAGLGVR
jgi:hypothetical protein